MHAERMNFHPSDTKWQILIADDEEINRMMLAYAIGDAYDVLFACDGAETMEQIRQNKDTLSLILLDVLMPVMSGLEVLKTVREDEELSHIPIIVTTSERETEIESLNLGAIDFVPKPYPPEGVIKARVKHAIELSEDRDIIQSTERDDLTGLYNKDYFYRYAEQLDQSHKDVDMDAVLVDINHFHMINERYGRPYGDDVLRRLADRIREMVREDIGIVCRRDADTFLVYAPHRDDYDQIMEQVGLALTEEELSENRIRLRMGIYENVDKEVDVERRFDRAKGAADTVKGSFTQNIAFYDASMHDRQIYEEQLIVDFPVAIAENQFKVLYQPKFDVRPGTPMLASAEALVRWMHPELGMISPGVFIPLFEENGLIQQLDNYVWNETARQVREWKDRLGYSVPVSVNVSRVDMFDPRLKENLLQILEQHDLKGKDIYLEVTESAYAEDHEKIIETVEDLRQSGFFIEMDDFGTGYSTLNMISSLPIDALKIDMQFVRDAFREGGNTHMLEVILGISKFLSVPSIAEGVETEEQLRTLRELGCDLVQGYFFSKPVHASEFEAFILQKKAADHATEEAVKAEKHVDESVATAALAAWEEAVEPDRETAAEPDAETQVAAAEPEKPQRTAIHMKTTTIAFAIIALAIAAALFISDMSLANGYRRMEAAGDRYIAAQQASADMQMGSDYLTDRVRSFVFTGDMEYLEDFTEEVEVTKRRDNAVKDLDTLLEGSDPAALQSLNRALELSNKLVDIENYAMRLVLETGEYDPADIPDSLKAVELSPEDQALSNEAKQAKARNLVLGDQYIQYKGRIRDNVSKCTEELMRTSSENLEASSVGLAHLVNFQTVLTILLLLLILAIIVVIRQMVRIPLAEMVQKMQEQQEIKPSGVEELRFVTRTYNEILRENEASRERLEHAASHDALTGLFNRGAYDLLMQSADQNHMALILLDVDHFKEVNDTYGHAVGDRVLQKVADILRQSFRSVDILCRIGGDEFVVVMTRADSSMSQLVIDKINRANAILQNPQDDLPPVSLSVGVAFADRENPKGDIFRDADDALYQVKKAGRNGCVIF